MLTQSDVRKLFTYNEETGELIRRTSPSNSAKIGTRAGGFDAYGYMTVKVNNKTYKAHRIIWLYYYGYLPHNQLDHINGNRADNRISNLRQVKHRDNMLNKATYKTNRSGLTGVRFRKTNRKWVAVISIKGVNKHLGYFEDWFEAVCARKSAENRLGYHPNHGRSNAS